jgi:hypothetical protein
MNAAVSLRSSWLPRDVIELQAATGQRFVRDRRSTSDKAKRSSQDAHVLARLGDDCLADVFQRDRRSWRC